MNLDNFVFLRKKNLKYDINSAIVDGQYNNKRSKVLVNSLTLFIYQPTYEYIRCSYSANLSNSHLIMYARSCGDIIINLFPTLKFSQVPTVQYKFHSIRYVLYNTVYNDLNLNRLFTSFPEG